MTNHEGAEHQRLAEAHANQAPWYRWGPYLAERQWGTVREDYSPDGTAWSYFPHDHARSRVYRWGEDGLLGLCDDSARLCFALALWNQADPILKERLFGLTGPEGNHGEDVKESYFYLDNTPTHSYMRALYRYPQRAFPYAELVAENGRRDRTRPEYELIDTGVFADDRYFDVTIEYAKASPDDIVIRIQAINHGPDPAPLRVLPTLWFRNTWSWGRNDYRPRLRAVPSADTHAFSLMRAEHERLGDYWLAAAGTPELLFTENESNLQRLWGVPNRSRFVKDGIGAWVIEGATGAVNPERTGTRAAAHYRLTLAPGTTETIWLRLSATRHADPFADASELLARRQAEADAFYQTLAPAGMPEDACRVLRQALAGLLWTKQFYRYDVRWWLDGDPGQPPPPPERRLGRNHDWRHLDARDLISMPDSWEYPWFAAWDLSFQCIPLALIDAEFAKNQLIMLGREWYQHPNGQLPAYEWEFSRVNPPVEAWAAWRVYKIERHLTGRADRAFLERVFHKLLLSFTWWVNRKDPDGRNVFAGGFLGLDNIGVFDRSAPLPGGEYLQQADGTAWMGMFCLEMLAIALELAREDCVYEDLATKFFEHFLSIAAALNNLGGGGMALWDETDGFFYDVLRLPGGECEPLRLRSLVGLIPLLAVETIEPQLLAQLPDFRSRMNWYLENRPDLANLVSRWSVPGAGKRSLLSLVHGERLRRLLERVLDPDEFLSEHGVRSLSRQYAEQPYRLRMDGREHTVGYEPAESSSGMFGGNSNWRGPVWFPINFLLIEALQRFHHYYGEHFQVEFPARSGERLSLGQVADALSRRLTHLFLRGPDGRRPVFGANDLFQDDPRWRDYLLFYEYFNGDTGEGVGASHQTGWTALVAKLLQQTEGR